MRENWRTRVVGWLVVLVPYRRAHVRKYHDWMSSPQLLALTGSEPLDLDEEFRMQRTWRDGEDKCTFIVLDKETFDRTGGDELASMVGDTNLFLSDADDDGDGPKTARRMAEVEIMVAEPWARRRGLGREAAALMMRYGAERLAVEAFTAKIKEDNAPSLALFAQMGFREVGRSAVFGEVTLRMDVDEAARRALEAQTRGRRVEEYEHPAGEDGEAEDAA